MIVYRHPTPDAPPGLCYGRTDLALAEEAVEEIARAAATPPEATAIVTSPATRARALAEALAASTGASLLADARLWELDFGAWEGRLWSELDRTESDPWAEDPWRRAPPGGETFAALSARVLAAVEAAPEGAVFVAHAGPIRALMMARRGVDFAEAFATKIPYATPITLMRELV